MSVDVTLIAPKKRFVIVHYHIFKNAGSTLEFILEREFPGRFARIHGPAPDATLDGGDLTAFLEDHPGIQAVTSHHLRYPAPSIRNIIVFDCCFLRHPLDRLDSVYSYFRKIDSTDPLCRLAHRQSPAEFMRHLLEHSPEQVSNVQVTHLANQGAFTRPAHTGDLERAIQTVRNMALPGTVEMFRESMAAAEYFMKPAFPSIRLGARAVNVSRPNLPEDRQNRLRELWGTDLYQHLAHMNQLDIELFESTSEEVTRRLNLIPKMPERIADYGRRCDDLAANAG